MDTSLNTYTEDRINAEIITDVESQNLDPLGLDRYLFVLAEANEQQDVPTLRKILDYALEIHATRKFSCESQRKAIHRDIGFLVASMATHGVGFEIEKHYEVQLLEIADVIGEVPRDTVYSYTTRNPMGQRQRKFTNLEAEELFIDVVRKSTIAMLRTVCLLSEAYVNFDDLDSFIDLIDAAHKIFQPNIELILSVRNEISPYLFTNYLRPYFPPITVRNEIFFGPGGAQMPLLLIDTILCRPAINQPATNTYSKYDSFYSENAKYMPLRLREIGDVWSRQESMVELLVNNYCDPHIPTVETQFKASKVKSLLQLILKFRYPHKRIAEENFSLRPPSSLGSGGYTLDPLHQTIDITTRSIKSLSKLCG